MQLLIHAGIKYVLVNDDDCILIQIVPNYVTNGLIFNNWSAVWVLFDAEPTEVFDAIEGHNATASWSDWNLQ